MTDKDNLPIMPGYEMASVGDFLNRNSETLPYFKGFSALTLHK